MKKAIAAVALLAALGGGAVWAADPAVLAWAFPGPGAPSAKGDPAELHALPGTPVRYTDAQARNSVHIADWRPETHPPMPEAVSTGKPGILACGYCHTPSGGGRPENAALAGLPADYITRQVAAFVDGSRAQLVSSYAPATTMAMVTKAASPELIAAAAKYFSGTRYVSHVKVVEARTIPHAEASNYIYKIGGASEPLGDRIVEGTTDMERFELRDPALEYTAYVPVGAIREGTKLAKSGGPAAQPCAACHGAGLRGEIGPPLAGRSPTSMFRQLLAFHEGGRNNAEAEPMRMIAKDLSVHQMIALAAYMGSLKP